MSDNVIKFPATSHKESLLFDDLIETLNGYAGEVTLTGALGVLELVKLTLIEDAHGGPEPV
jgi:hypothetical protein